MDSIIFTAYKLFVLLVLSCIVMKVAGRTHGSEKTLKLSR